MQLISFFVFHIQQRWSSHGIYFYSFSLMINGLLVHLSYLISSINSICSSTSQCLPNLPHSLSLVQSTVLCPSKSTAFCPSKSLCLLNLPYISSLVQSTVFCPSTSRCLLDLPHTHNNYSHLHLVNILH